MPFFTKHDVCIFFSHIPKTGGTSVEDYLTFNGFDRSFYSSPMHPCSLQHRHLADSKLSEERLRLEPKFSFAFFRDPLSRMKSEYFMRLKGKTPNPSNFEYFVKNGISKYKKNPYRCDNHFRPQIEFVDEKIKVFRFGDWTPFIDDLERLEINLKGSFPHSNKSSKVKLNWHQLKRH